MIARTRSAEAARRGMSLLEVLVSLAIFLLSLVAIAKLVDLGADRSADAVMQNTGTRLAQSKLAEVEAGVIPVSGGGAGAFDDEPGWEWSAEAGAAPAPNVYPVTVKVWREARGKRFEVSLTQLICDPQAMGTGAAAVSPDAATTTSSSSSSTTAGGTGP